MNGFFTMPKEIWVPKKKKWRKELKSKHLNAPVNYLSNSDGFKGKLNLEGNKESKFTAIMEVHCLIQLKKSKNYQQ